MEDDTWAPKKVWRKMQGVEEVTKSFQASRKSGI